MKKRSLPIFIISAIIVTLIIGIVIGRYSGHSTSTEKKPSYWVDSMEPTIHYPGPGQSRMGMELTPVYPEEGQGTDETTVRISPTLVNNLGVRIVPVVQGTLSKRIEAVGYVEPNENKISHIHTYADGWVKKLFVKAVGEVVKEDQVVLQLYSPILVSAQEEYLIALGSGDKSLMDASIKKMQTLHIPEQQIQQLKTTRKSSQLIDIYPHQNGVLTH
jgi:Cu(I)/Ag(I) efflux system membrane fusion protein